MVLSKNENEILMRDVHCPYCNTDKAILFKKTSKKRLSLGSPAYGLKTLFSILYLGFIYIFVKGFKFFDLTKEIENINYAFCPNCGNSYSLQPTIDISTETEEPHFYRIKTGKVVFGFCKGVSEYTNISLAWIRIMTVIYGILVVLAPAFSVYSALKLSFMFSMSDVAANILAIFGFVIAAAICFAIPSAIVLLCFKYKEDVAENE